MRLDPLEAALKKAASRMTDATQLFEGDARLARTEHTESELTMLRLRSLADDIAAIMPLARELHERALRGQVAAAALFAGKTNAELTRETWQEKADLSRPTDALLVTVKMMFFLVRALQDCAYKALVVLSGNRAGGSSSMANALDAWKANPTPDPRHWKIHHTIEQAAPGFFTWFDGHRSMRNKFKEGEGVGYTCELHGDGSASLKIETWAKPLTLATIEESIQYGARRLSGSSKPKPSGERRRKASPY